MITKQQLISIMPFARSRADLFLPFINKSMTEFEIKTAARQAAFLAQIAHESGELRYTKEIASGQAYEGRKDLGNTLPGDGVKYKGRGLIQITGKTNYMQAMMALDLDLVNHPELLETPENATRSAAWWWSDRKLNELADAENFDAITKKINGGYNGKSDRDGYYEKAKKVLGVV